MLAGAAARDGDEVREDGLRQQVILPTDFRVPLDAEYELFRARVDDRFDDAVGGPCDGFEVAAYDVYGLMMMAVDRCVRRTGQPRDQRFFGDVDRMRAPPENVALHVLERVFDFRRNILNQGAA